MITCGNVGAELPPPPPEPPPNPPEHEFRAAPVFELVLPPALFAFGFSRATFISSSSDAIGVKGAEASK